MVLVAAVTALALMSVLALGLAETTVLDERLAEKSLAALQADALARSGVAVATVVLAETGAAGAPDTLRAPWAVDERVRANNRAPTAVANRAKTYAHVESASTWISNAESPPRAAICARERSTKITSRAITWSPR